MAFDLNVWTAQFKAALTQALPESYHRFVEMLAFEDTMLYHQETRHFVVDNPLLEAVSEEFAYRVAMARARALGRELSPRLGAVLTVIANSPGEIVMYVSALHALYPKEVLTARLFQEMSNFKVLSDESSGKVWDAQKGIVNGEQVDNCLDYLTPAL